MTTATYTINHQTYMKFAFNIMGDYDVSIVLIFGNGELRVEIVHNMTVYHFCTIECSLAQMTCDYIDDLVAYFDDDFALQFLMEIE